MHEKTAKHLDVLRGEIESVRMAKGKNLVLHKDSITPKEMAEWSKEPWRLRQLPTLFVTLLQTVYKADVNEWKHAEEKISREEELVQHRERLWSQEEESLD